MNYSTPPLKRKNLPPTVSLDPLRLATDYLGCLRAIGHSCAGDGSADEMSRSVAGLLVEQCADIDLVLVYRADASGERAMLRAVAGDIRDAAAAPPRVELATPFAWPLALQESGPEETASGRLIVAIEPSPGARALGWLILEAAGLHTQARTLFTEAAAQALAIGLVRGAARESVRLRADALAQREQTVSGFLGQISDEIRTPLTLLLGPLEAAVDRHGDMSLRAALRNAHRLRRLVDALVDLSHIDAGRIEPVLVPIDIAAMTRDVASLFIGAATAAGVALTIDCPALPQPVYVDRMQWEQVLINLLGNAIRFTASGEVRVSLRAHVGLMTLEVADTGRGIDPDELPHIFERFHRAKDREDSGLGLALVRELVRLHGGDIEASSVPGQGSRFRVCIPMLGTPARAAPHRHVTDLPMRAGRRRPSDALGWAARATLDAVVDVVPSTQERILVVVDHGELRDYVAGLLRPHYRVQALGAGDDPLQAVHDRAPDLVLVDLGGTSSQGHAFIRSLRASAHGAMVPALLLASDTREFAHADAMAAGADDMIGKPFAAAELLARVDAHMRLSSERRALHRRLTDHNRDLEAQVVLRTAALSASEAQFRAISNLVPDILWRADAQGRVEWRSQQWTRFTGDGGVDTGMSFVYPDDRAATQAWLRDTIGGCPLAPHEYRLRRHDGHYHWFVARMSPTMDADGVVQHWFGSATDIEGQRLARQALELRLDEGTVALERATNLQQELLHRLARSQEDERRRIARELHDSLGQYLTALKLVLSALVPALADPQVRELVSHLDALTTEVDRELDDIIAALRPVVLDELGLVGALPGIVADWSRRSGIAAEVLLVQVDEERFDDESESTLYRVTQECLTNIVKHAQARNVAVTLARRQDELHLSVEDDGIGFDPAVQGARWGLRGMEERARGAGGLLQVESTPGAGTTILVRLPTRGRSALPTTRPPERDRP